jgi:DNA-binding HxlR family transcriptional regulator
MGVLGAKWVLRVLRALQSRPLRYNELMRGLPRIHPTVLADTLRRMQAAGLLERHVDPGPPAAVTYLLTSLAYDSLPLVTLLARWAREHKTELGLHEAWEPPPWPRGRDAG